MNSAPATPTPNSVTRTELLLLAALVALVTALYTIYALKVGNFQNDEEQYLQLARYVAAHFPGALWDSAIYPRGLQRLDPIILALPFALARGPDAYQLAHLIQCLLFASTAIPVFLLARRAGLVLAAALFAATLSVIVPWGVTATSFLTESAAYPAYAWLLYATWMLILAPSRRREWLALLALLVAALSRTALLALVPVLPLAVLWHELGWGLTGKPWSKRLRELPARLWERYGLLSVLSVLAILALGADRLGLLPGRGLAAFAGDYGLPQLDSLGNMLARYRDYLARMAVGTGLLALALGLPWAVAALLRPRSAARHATAVVCTLGLGAILLSLVRAGPDERYVLYAAVPISLCAAASLAEAATHTRPRRSYALGVLTGAVAVCALIAATTWPAPVNPYDFFTYPAGVFYQRVLLARASTLDLRLIHPTPGELVEGSILILALVWALAASRGARVARVGAALMGVGLLSFSATQTLYTLRKYTSGAGAATGPNASARSWVDEHVPAGARVGALALSMGATADYLPIWRATEFWNTTVHVDAYFGGPGALPLPLGSEGLNLHVDPRTGLLHGYLNNITPVPTPRYLLVPEQGTNEYGLHGEVVATSSYLPLLLVKLNGLARIDWAVQGTSVEGFLAPAQPATATVYEAALASGRTRCATFSLIAPPSFKGSWPYEVQSGERTLARGKLVALQTALVIVPLLPRRTSAGTTATLTVHVHGSVAFATGQTVSAKLAFFTVADCPATGAG